MLQIAKRITNNFFWLLMSDVVFRGALFVGTLYIARQVGTSEFGLFSFAMAVSLYVWWSFVDLGVTQYGIREAARAPGNAHELLGVLNSLRFFASLAAFAIITAVLFSIDIPQHKRIMILSACLYLITFSISPGWLLRGIERMAFMTFENIVGGMFFVGLILIMVKGPGDASKAALIWSLSFLLGSVAVLIVMRVRLGLSFRLRFSWSLWKRHLKNSFFFALNGSMYRVYTYIPILILGFLVSSEDLGIFSAPQGFIIALLNFNFVVPRAFYPVLSSLHKDTDAFKVARDGFQKIMVAIGIPLGLLCTVMSEDVIGLMYGKEFISGAAVLQIAIWQVPIGFMLLSYGTPLLAMGLERFRAAATGVGVFATVVLNLLLIPIYGIAGAAIASLIGGFIMLLSMYYVFTKRVYSTPLIDGFFIRVCCASALMSFIVVYLGPNVIINLVAGVLLYLVFSLLFGVISRKGVSVLFRAVMGNLKPR